MRSAFDLSALLLVLTATFGWVNHLFIRLPHTIGLFVMGLGSSLLLIGVELAFPDVLLYEEQRRRLIFTVLMAAAASTASGGIDLIQIGKLCFIQAIG